MASAKDSSMAVAGGKERRYFDLAFELAYCIHANREVAFFVAEDALDALASAFVRQEKNRTPSDRLRGFLKWGERTRPVRKTVRLGEEQLLQWLVYRQSEPWERETEAGDGLYLPTEEDMIVRYVEHLVFLSLRRGSFYVTLAACALLHQFSRRETRLFYEVLTQHDPARAKDAGYVGKQRLELLEKVSQRFGKMTRTAQKPGGEKQFVTRETTPRVIELVNESLRRFAPWGATCAVEPGFEVTDIPGLYFSESAAHDEEMIELNRVHAVIDPDCFARLAAGLSKYVRTLPEGDQDRGCNFDASDERVAVPQFDGFPAGTPRGDRFQAPKLTREDYVRLQRTLDARARRRRDFRPRQLRVFVDDAPLVTFDPKTTRGVKHVIGAPAGVVEVRGSDDTGELTLATLLFDEERLDGGEFRGSIVQPGGQKVSVRLKPFDGNGNGRRAQLEVSYRETSLTRVAARLVGQAGVGSGGDDGGDEHTSARGGAWRRRWARVGAAALLVAAASALVWWWLSHAPTRHELKPAEQVRAPQLEQPGNVEEQARSDKQAEVKPTPTPASPTPTPKQRSSTEDTLVARAAWSADRDATLHAIAVEPTRGETRPIDLSERETKVVLSLPFYDDEGRAYARYRLTLSSASSRLWQQTLRAPDAGVTKYAHILSLSLFTSRLPASGPYDLKVEGDARDGWRPIGHVTFSPKD